MISAARADSVFKVIRSAACPRASLTARPCVPCFPGLVDWATRPDSDALRVIEMGVLDVVGAGAGIVGAAGIFLWSQPGAGSAGGTRRRQPRRTELGRRAHIRR